MSRAGRYAHQQNKNRHNQGKKAGAGLMVDTISTATWLSETMKACRMFALQTDNLWSVEHLATWQDTSTDEAERRLRYLVKLGFLNMAVERESGQFVRYTFSMVDVNLPE